MSATAEQPTSAADRRAIRQAYADDLFTTADEINREYKRVLEAKTANREELRNMAKQGHLSAAQVRRLNDLYPERTISEEAKAKRRATREQRRASQQNNNQS